MKYIRTNDGRILEFDKLNEVSKLSIDMAEEPIREAYTIEELCDEIVSVYGETHTIIAIDISPKKILHNMKSWKVEADIYGAIWTNKGLIYVAKMNDKGELELI